jgi:proteasome lid subunit RPN8/RPN11
MECCGVLIGRNSGGGHSAAIEAIPCRNVHDGDRRSRFRVDPTDLISALELASARGLEVIGFFHSHPDRESEFSPEDALNAWPNQLHVVLSVRAGTFSGASAYRTEKGFADAAQVPLSRS